MKKVIGFILLAIGGFMCLTALIGIPGLIAAIVALFTASNVGTEFYFYQAGQITSIVVALVIAFFAIKYGLRFVKQENSKTKVDVA